MGVRGLNVDSQEVLLDRLQSYFLVLLVTCFNHIFFLPYASGSNNRIYSLCPAQIRRFNGFNYL